MTLHAVGIPPAPNPSPRHAVGVSSSRRGGEPVERVARFNNHNDPNSRPPFRQHPYYYPAIKILVLLVAVYFAARILGYL